MQPWRKVTIAAAAIACVALAVAASCSMYFIRDGSGGWVLSNDSEAYFFTQTNRDGLEISYLRYPWMIVREYFYAVELPTERCGILVVLHVTRSAAESHQSTVLDPAAGPILFTPIDGKIYANCPQLGGLCRWAEDHFERASPAERVRLGDNIDHLTNKEAPRNQDGWSKLGFRPTFTINVNDQLSLLINNPLDDVKQGSITIDRIRPGNSPERVWDFPVRRGQVSRAEYERAFRDCTGK